MLAGTYNFLFNDNERFCHGVTTKILYSTAEHFGVRRGAVG
jgi:hypothetical protein